MKHCALTRFVVNDSINKEIAGLDLSVPKILKVTNYPSLLQLMSDNGLRNFAEIKIVKATGTLVHNTPGNPLRIFFPIVPVTGAEIKFTDGVSYQLSTAIAFENATYEINVPADQELVYGVIAGTIDYSSSVSKYTSDPFETFVFSLK